MPCTGAPGARAPHVRRSRIVAHALLAGASAPAPRTAPSPHKHLDGPRTWHARPRTMAPTPCLVTPHVPLGARPIARRGACMPITQLPSDSSHCTCALTCSSHHSGHHTAPRAPGAPRPTTCKGAPAWPVHLACPPPHADDPCPLPRDALHGTCCPADHPPPIRPRVAPAHRPTGRAWPHAHETSCMCAARASPLGALVVVHLPAFPPIARTSVPACITGSGMLLAVGSKKAALGFLAPATLTSIARDRASPLRWFLGGARRAMRMGPARVLLLLMSPPLNQMRVLLHVPRCFYCILQHIPFLT